MPADTRPRVAIAVATYRRPAGLRTLLDSIRAEGDDFADVRFVVADNDAEGSAREVAEEFGAQYEIEPRPGIAAARNRCLSMLRGEDDYVVFVDDDEFVSEGWLRTLVGGHDRYGAAIVTGPVITLYPPETPRWIIKGGHLQRERFETGRRIEYAASNNTSVAVDVLRRSAVRFDDAYSQTGGSDTDFFDRLRPFAGDAVWVDEAEVSEPVPLSRANFRWIARRGIRGGNVFGRVQSRHKSRAWILADAAARVVAFTARGLFYLVVEQRIRATDLTRVTFNIGRIATCVGYNVQEYVRPAAASRA